MTDTRRTAYWTRLPQPADRTVCWRDGCTDSGVPVQSERLGGFYCETHIAATLADADRLSEMEGEA